MINLDRVIVIVSSYQFRGQSKYSVLARLILERMGINHSYTFLK